jgi:predicted GNAT family acetyltransferase
MDAHVHQSPAEFREIAGPLLSADPVRNTVLLTAMHRAGADAILITLHDNGKVVGAVLQTPPYALIATAMPIDAAEITAKAVHTVRPRLSGSSGPVGVVDAFNKAWTDLTGVSARPAFELRLFELGELEPPDAEGQARQATQDDLPLITHWRGLFMDETLHGIHRDRDEDGARQSLTPGNISIFWEVDGKPVSYAAARGPIAGMVRVAPVYTPPEQRGRGYGSAATAAVSQLALDQGAEHVLLYTDLKNPTSNHIYQTIGYRPLADYAEYTFINVEI